MIPVKIDFSVIPSLECDLECSFCMYDAGPHNKATLSYSKTKSFLATWDWSIINQVGFYGGEPSINLPLYQTYMNLVPPAISKFVITNGSWSTDTDRTDTFINFLCKNKLFLIVSGTPEHRVHQSRPVLRALKDYSPEATRLKGNDVIHRMGRGANYPGAISSCGGFCNMDNRVMRLAIMPSGNIVYQNCHGNYPVVQTIDDPFEGIHRRALQAAQLCASKQRGG